MTRSPDGTDLGGTGWPGIGAWNTTNCACFPLGLTAATYPYVQGIGASRDGGLWIACDGRIRKWKEGQWVEDLGNAPWGESPVTRLVETRNGVLAAGTADRGLFLIFPGQHAKAVAL